MKGTFLHNLSCMILIISTGFSSANRHRVKEESERWGVKVRDGLGIKVKDEWGIKVREGWRVKVSEGNTASIFQCKTGYSKEYCCFVGVAISGSNFQV